MSNAYAADCTVCHTTIAPGDGHRARYGWTHTSCAPARPRPPRIDFKAPVNIRAELVRWKAKDCALSWPYTDGSLEEGGKRIKFFWLPRSQVTDNKDGTIMIPRWLQEKSGVGLFSSGKKQANERS
jgi:hypothetical protein